MRPLTLRALVVAVVALGVGAATFALISHGQARDKPKVTLLTGLPLVAGENFSVDAPPAPILAEWRKHYTVLPIDISDPASLAKAKIAILVQPRAQPPENLVALDHWVRNGGNLLLFVDPLLEWHSQYPLGDPARPPVMFADTGLLGHWGLRLDAPDHRGETNGRIDDQALTLRSPGTLVRTGGTCAVNDGGLFARCAIGKGQAIVVADADMLDLEALKGAATANVRAVDGLIASLEK